MECTRTQTHWVYLYTGQMSRRFRPCDADTRTQNKPLTVPEGQDPKQHQQDEYVINAPPHPLTSAEEVCRRSTRFNRTLKSGLVSRSDW